MKTITFGRGWWNNVVINDDRISRRHVAISKHSDGSFTLRDLGSLNGTYVNGKKVHGKVFLHKSDVVMIGKTTLKWQKYFTKNVHSVNPYLLATTILSSIAIISVLIFSFIDRSVYDEDNINQQVLISISKNVSYSEACNWLTDQEIRILKTDQSFGYFLVCAKKEKVVDDLIQNLRNSNYISCAIRNHQVEHCGIKMSAIDNFSTSMSEKSTISHGEMVTKTMEAGANIRVTEHDIKKNSKIGENEIAENFIQICKQMSDDDMNIINISLGPKKEKRFFSSKEKTKKDYDNSYSDHLLFLSDLAVKCDKQNFIVTQAMGNDGEYIDDALELTKKKMTPEQQNALEEHIILVAAQDNRPGLDYGYSNRVADKVNGVNTIMVDISELETFQNGTSAAAPLVANWIAKSGFEKASDVVSTINEATKDGELASETKFKEVAQTKVKSNPYLQKEEYLKYGALLYCLKYDKRKDCEILVLHNNQDYDIRVKCTLLNYISVSQGTKYIDEIVKAHSTKYIDGYLDGTICTIHSVERVTSNQRLNNNVSAIKKDLIGQTIKDPSKNSYFPEGWKWKLEEREVLCVYEQNRIIDDKGREIVDVLAHLQRGRLKVDAQITMIYSKTTTGNAISEKTGNSNERYTKTIIIGEESGTNKTRLQAIQVKKITIPQQTDYSNFIKLEKNYDLLPNLQITNNSDYTLFVGGDYYSNGKAILWSSIVGGHSFSSLTFGIPDIYHIHFAYKK